MRSSAMQSRTAGLDQHRLPDPTTANGRICGVWLLSLLLVAPGARSAPWYSMEGGQA